MGYQPPGWLRRHLLNGVVMTAARLGISLDGASILSVRGRVSGRPRQVPVNPVSVDGTEFLVAPRGQTDWVRNLRAAGSGELRLGRRRRAIRVAEVADADKPPVLRAYLRRWAWVTRGFFGVGPETSEAELARIAPRHPVFRIVPSS